MYVKIHVSHRKVVAICDADLIGKQFEEGKKFLDVRENFYKGEKVDSKRAAEIMIREIYNYSTFNIVGEKSVKLALQSGIISEGNVGHVAGVPFALVLI